MDFVEAVSHPKYKKNTPSPVTRKGIVKKGDKLSPEHRAKISASLKKRAEEKKAQDERIQKTRA